MRGYTYRPRARGKFYPPPTYVGGRLGEAVGLSRVAVPFQSTSPATTRISRIIKVKTTIARRRSRVGSPSAVTRPTPRAPDVQAKLSRRGGLSPHRATFVRWKLRDDARGSLSTGWSPPGATRDRGGCQSSGSGNYPRRAVPSSHHLLTPLCGLRRARQRCCSRNAFVHPRLATPCAARAPRWSANQGDVREMLSRRGFKNERCCPRASNRRARWRARAPCRTRTSGTPRWPCASRGHNPR